MDNAAIQDFWTSFTQRADALARLESAEDPVYDEILAKLHAIDDGLYFEFSTQGRKGELIITAEGDKSLFGLVDEIIAAAPKTRGWSFVSLKPKVGLARSITWEGHVIDCAGVVFEPLENAKSGEFGIRMLIPDLPEDKRDSAHNGLLRVLDHALGERRFAEEIQFTEVAPLEGAADDHIPLSALDRFIDWRKARQEQRLAEAPRKKKKKSKTGARRKPGPAKKARKATKSRAKPARKRPRRKRR